MAKRGYEEIVDFMRRYPTATGSEVAKQLGLNVGYAYQLLADARRKGDIPLSEHPAGKRLSMPRVDDEDRAVAAAVAQIENAKNGQAHHARRQIGWTTPPITSEISELPDPIAPWVTETLPAGPEGDVVERLRTLYEHAQSAASRAQAAAGRYQAALVALGADAKGEPS
jgi:hypothetical protein